MRQGAADGMPVDSLIHGSMSRHRLRRPSEGGSPSEEGLARAVDGRC